MRKEHDADLVLAARSGNADAFGRLFDKWFTEVHEVAWRILWNRETAAEVAEDVFLAAWSQLDRIEPSAVGGWLLRTSRNRALNRRDQGRDTVVAAGAQSPDSGGPAGPSWPSETTGLRRADESHQTGPDNLAGAAASALAAAGVPMHGSTILYGAAAGGFAPAAPVRPATLTPLHRLRPLQVLSVAGIFVVLITIIAVFTVGPLFDRDKLVTTGSRGHPAGAAARSASGTGPASGASKPGSTFDASNGTNASGEANATTTTTDPETGSSTTSTPAGSDPFPAPTPPGPGSPTTPSPSPPSTSPSPPPTAPRPPPSTSPAPPPSTTPPATPPTSAPAPDPPVITVLRVAEVGGRCGRRGTQFAATWATTGATSVTLGPEGGHASAVATSGFDMVCGPSGSRFVLTATGPGGTVSLTS